MIILLQYKPAEGVAFVFEGIRYDDSTLKSGKGKAASGIKVPPHNAREKGFF
jgi:hypothetical protein